jgi:hypothetical protein
MVLVGMIYPIIFRHKSTNIVSKSIQIETPNKRLSHVFTSSVKSSVLGIINICGFVVFFYVLCGIIMDFFGKIGIPNSILMIVCSMLEMSCGCMEIAKILPPNAAFIACAMILGFSGISLHFQISSLCPDAEIKYGRFFAVKILSAVIAGICALAFNFIFKIFV